ncbi:hypothetical protein Taro_020776, partial [Colocasia esculenta]|nr:hypothetical protein [Colocasia esculenta]
LLFERRTQSVNPNWIPSVPTRHFNPPDRVGENGTPIRSLFEILDPGVIRHFNAQPNPKIQIRFRQFPHVTVTHLVMSEKTTHRSDHYLRFWTPDPSFQCPTQSGDPNWIPSVPTRHCNPPGRVGENCTPIRSLFGSLDPQVVCFDPLYILDYFLDPSFQCPIQSGDPNWIPSVPTRHFNPPGRVGENGTPIRSLFGILDPRVVLALYIYLAVFYIRRFNAQSNPKIQIGFRRFPHVTLTHPIVSEKTARRSDPYLGFWTPGLCVLTLYIYLTIF